MCPASIAFGGRGITLFGLMRNLLPDNPMKTVPVQRVIAPGGFRRLGLGVALLVVCLGSTGCVKSIYRRGDPRTQYDRYDASRNQFVPDYVEDEYCRLEPNLRGRLLVKN
jgi:hypothetical protein